MTVETTPQKPENHLNAALNNAKGFFNKIMGVTAEPETRPAEKGIGSKIPDNSGDEPIKWPLPVKK
jgi:hypothetical protein